jgi:hypothetical protein
MSTSLIFLFLRYLPRHHTIIFVISALILQIPFTITSFANEEKKFQLQVYLTKKQAFKIAFPEADEIKKEKQWLTSDQKLSIGELCLLTITENRFTFYLGIKNSKPMGYMLIDNIIGKSFPITFMTVLNLDGTVRDVEIMVYREPQGWEVRNKSFRSQFYGKDSSTDSRDIMSISGATLSATSITRGVYKAMAAYKVIYLNK